MNRPKYPPTKNIVANGLQDAYYKLIKATLNGGAIKERFYGKPVNTLDIVSLTEINYPLLEPMLHPNFPTKELHLKEYEKQWERTYDWKKQGFEYNYMDRLIKYPSIKSNDICSCNSPVSVADEKNICMKCRKELENYYHKSNKFPTIDQLKVIKDKISNKIENDGKCLVSNRDQIITWIPDRDLFIDEDQPCLQRIQFFVHKYPHIINEYRYYTHINDINIDNEIHEIYNGKIEFHCMWRSRDLYSAWNSNMIGLIKMLNKEIFKPNNLDLIRVVDFCNSLHIYESDWEEAKKVKPAILPPSLMV